MKRSIVYILLFGQVLLQGCMKLVDEEFWNDVNSLEERVTVLEDACAKLNATTESLLSLAMVYNNYDYVKDYSTICSNGKEIGYRINLGKGGEICLYHGIDGEDGWTPVVSLVPGNDGNWYWAINGELLLDGNGNPVHINNGYMPKFRIVERTWYISYDNGAQWNELSSAVGNDGNTFFYSLEDRGNNVVITLMDNSQFVVPKYVEVNVKFNVASLSLAQGGSAKIGYSIEGTPGEYVVEVFSEGQWYAEVEKSGEQNGFLEITAPAPLSDGKIVLFVSNKYSQMYIKTIVFKGGICGSL